MNFTSTECAKSRLKLKMFLGNNTPEPPQMRCVLSAAGGRFGWPTFDLLPIITVNMICYFPYLCEWNIQRSDTTCHIYSNLTCRPYRPSIYNLCCNLKALHTTHFRPSFDQRPAIRFMSILDTLISTVFSFEYRNNNFSWNLTLFKMTNLHSNVCEC